jgi:SRSO17 transposase
MIRDVQAPSVYAAELRLLSTAEAALDEVQQRIGPRFRRVEVRRGARRCLDGLRAPVARKNGWQLAEARGERGPHGVQRLLAEAHWEQEAVRDEVRSYVLDHLGEVAGILVVDETGFLKKGRKSAGVAPQYSGTAGGRATCQIGVFLLDASSQGAAFLDRELYLPAEWTTDQVRCREAGIPDAVDFATKGALAQRMLQRTGAAGVRAAWVVGDTI